MWLSRGFLLLCLLFFFPTGCQPNYFLLHPLEPVPGVYREYEFFDRGQLRVHWLARYPDRPGPLPAVLVHPDRGSLSEDMEGICLALARKGYFAAAVDYQRLENLEVRNPLLPWKSAEEATVSLKHLQSHPRVNPERIALLGYSKGAILSLQIASLAPDIKAVIAYYPMTDFEEWRKETRDSLRWRLFSWFFRWQMEREAGTTNREELSKEYWGPAPITLVDKIQSPVLLVHGEKDRTFPLRQSQRFCRAMRSAGKSCELLVIPGAGHVFNFLNVEQGQRAWARTTHFLEEHLFPSLVFPSSSSAIGNTFPGNRKPIFAQ
jgi:dienelactone hydrolase